MLEWYWNSPFDLMVFYTIAIAASAILIIQIFLLLIGGDGDGLLDADIAEMDHGEGLGLLSLRSVTGFFGGFGWTGVIALENGMPLWAAVLLGIVVGLLLALSVAYLIKVLYSLRESGTADFHDSIGQVGTVYISIPPNNSGPGKIRVMIDGRLKVVLAYTGSAKRIPSQQRVKVVDLMDEHTLLVEPLNAERPGKEEGQS